jgi:hypothetical protein
MRSDVIVCDSAVLVLTEADTDAGAIAIARAYPATVVSVTVYEPGLTGTLFVPLARERNSRAIVELEAEIASRTAVPRCC